MRKQALLADLCLLLTACIWGFGFVAQRSGMDYVGPFSYNGIRFILGSLALLPLIVCLRRAKKAATEAGLREKKHSAFAVSLAAGTLLFTAVTIQQFGILFTTAGNAGFITGLYVILTPILGIFLGKKTGLPVWIGAVFTVAGLYFVSAAAGKGGSPGAVNPGDLIIMVSAVFWAAHVLLIDRLVRDTDPLTLSAGQFTVAGIFALIAAFTVEPFVKGWLAKLAPRLSGDESFAWYSLPDFCAGLFSGEIPLSLLAEALVPLLYGGLASVGIGYTLQVVAQRHAEPAHATIILCLEGSFAALGGVLVRDEKLGAFTLLGFALMLAGMVISQLDAICAAKKIPRQTTGENKA